MPENTYIAELMPAEYDQFREKDATLPATYEAWRVSHVERIKGMRRNRQIPISYPIGFEDCDASLRIHRLDHNQESRDFYADSQAWARIAEERSR